MATEPAGQARAKVVAFVNALNAKFENKQSNKKNDISGDFSSDTTSYPTVQAVKNWVGTQMSNVGSIILGETSDTAYRGDRGKTAYDHSQVTSGNPHNVTKSDVGLSNVTNVAQEAASNKVASWSSTTTDTHYPSEKLVKDSLDGKAPTNHASSTNTYGLGSSSNFGHVKIASMPSAMAQANTMIGTALDIRDAFTLKQTVDGKASVSHDHTVSDITDFPSIPAKTSDLTNDGSDGTNAFVSTDDSRLSDARTPTNHAATIANYPYGLGSKTKMGHVTLVDGFTGTMNETILESYRDGYALSAHAGGLLYNDLQNKANTSDLTAKEDVSNKKANWSSTPTNTNYPSEKLVKDSLDNKVDKVSGKGLSTNDFTNTYKTALDNLSTNLSSKDITVEKKGTAESGYIASYVVKQNGSQVGATINIPKDYLVKSASVGTVTTANDPVTGYVVGDRYIDFIINTKDNSGTNEHLYVLVSDLVDTYTADESTLTLSNNTFSVKNGGITLTKLASGVQTSLGYADAWNSSAAKNITSSDITNWNGKSTLTIADVDSEIEEYLDEIITLLSA